MQRFLHRSVARDTVRKHVLSLRAGAGRFGLFSAIFVMRISTPDKAGGLVRPRPPALHRLAGGQFGPDGKCLFCSFLWAHAKVELVEVRSHFGSGVGTFFELFWDFYVRRVKKWGHISGSVSGLAFRRFLVARSGFLSSEVFRDCFLVSQVLPAVRCCGLLAVACKADSARYIFWFLPQVAAGHLQALLGLVLLVHSRAG